MDIRVFNKYLLILSCAFAWLLSTPSFAQGGDRKEELRIRKTQLQDDIQIANKILEEARESRASSVTTLQTLNQKLRIREELLRTMDREIVLIDREIEEQEAQIEKLRLEIDTLKAKYAEMIRLAYRNKSQTSRLMFVFSSSSFDQAMRRIQYLRQYSEYRRQQVARIEERQSELEYEIAALQRQKEEKEELRTLRAGEREQLIAEQSEQQRTITELQQQEGTLLSQIQTKQSEVDRLENEIQRIIAEEVRKARARAERNALEERALAVGLVRGRDFNSRTTNDRLTAMIAEARARATTPPAPEPEPVDAYALTPEGARLARSFEANKGKLPWPVERGITVSRFGRQPHPCNCGLTINNPHIEIGTSAGSEARAAFDGVVLDVIRIPGVPITVIVQHGNYYTHYANLSESYVKSGDQVTARQAIGKIFTDPQENRTVLQFGMWKEDQVIDPYPWLAR